MAPPAQRPKARKPRRPARRPRKAKAPQVPMLRNSERSSFNACPWQWDRSYNDRLTPTIESVPLRFGSLIHAALEARYPPGIKRGPKPAVTFEKLYEAELKEATGFGFRDADGEWADAAQLGVDMLEGYVDEYGRDEEIRVVASELSFQCPVVVTQELVDSLPEQSAWHAGLEAMIGSVLFNYVGTMDGVWQDRMTDGVRVHDYKTTSNNPLQEAAAKQMLDEQATSYWKFGADWLRLEGILKPKELASLDGMMYTFLYKGKKDTRPEDSEGRKLNKDQTISKKQPVQRFHREIVYRDEAQQEQALVRAVQQFLDMSDARSGARPIYKTPGTGYPNQQCKACAFRDLCDVDEAGQDYGLLARSTMKKWNPYDAHEIREGDVRA